MSAIYIKPMILLLIAVIIIIGVGVYYVNSPSAVNSRAPSTPYSLSIKKPAIVAPPISLVVAPDDPILQPTLVIDDSQDPRFIAPDSNISDRFRSF